MRKAWLAFAAALTIGAAALATSTPAAAQCGGCYGSDEPRGLFTSAGYGCGSYGYSGYGYGGCGCNGAGYSGAGYYGGSYSGSGYYGRGSGYYGAGHYGRGYYGGGYYGGGYYRPHLTAYGVERRHARRVYRRAARWYY